MESVERIDGSRNAVEADAFEADFSNVFGCLDTGLL